MPSQVGERSPLVDEQRLRAELRARDRATRPDETFSDQLFARLATELQLRPAAQGGVRRPARSARRWLPAIALALLTVATVGALAFLARPDDDRLACTPELAADAAQRLRESAGYTYYLEGWLETPQIRYVGGELLPSRTEVVVDGEVAGDAAHERYLSGGQHAFGDPVAYQRTDAAIMVADDLWLRNYIGADPNRPWMAVELIQLDVREANLALHVADRLVRMIEGPAGAPPAAWTAVDEEVGPDATLCTLRDERPWSAASDALRTVTLGVDVDTGLPVSLSEKWQGFGYGGRSVDRQFDVTVAYPAVAPSIVPPPPDQVSPNLDQFKLGPSEVFPEARQTIAAPGEVIVHDADGPYAKVTVTEVVERRGYEGMTAAPGNVYLSFYSRHESLREGPAGSPGSVWQVYAHGPGSPPSTPIYHLSTHIDSPLQPPLTSAPGVRAVGDVFEGWLTFEVPADGEVSMWFLNPAVAEARVILRQDRPADVEESPAADATAAR